MTDNPDKSDKKSTFSLSDTLVKADYATVEARVMSVLAHLCLKHHTSSVYTAIACEISGKTSDEITENERQTAKREFFREIYVVNALPKLPDKIVKGGDK